ncbi:hypothetical protein K435DRAFT_879039 [Dendrothele bispora CBS 962.96]|uniref:Uncharacterized protein n=1 Tax=Dendrothele bispora (strain CBS 962.96) TaxID=1314807 RepID=A0A4V4HAR5_DENBC|nr:hypothetical protein K435DRAFT_879039 [Dendrothele bispora CBS 962.96]
MHISISKGVLTSIQTTKSPQDLVRKPDNAVDSLLCLQQARSWVVDVDPQPTREESSRTYVPGSTHRYLEFKTFRDHSNSIHVDFGGESTTIQTQMPGKVVKPRPRDRDGSSETAGVKLGLRVDFVAKDHETAAKLREFLIVSCAIRTHSW